MKEMFSKEELELLEKYTGKKQEQIVIGEPNEQGVTPPKVDIDNFDEVDEILYDIL